MVVGGVATTALVSADEVPTRVLQAVDVRLGTDGAIERLSAVKVSKGDSASSTSTTVLDPNDPANALPVRVTVGWVHDGRTGTDLADLEGVDGRVEITVTVQNTTLRPERFAYDVAGSPRDSYALVGTPLTVVASATLPEGSFDRLRQAPAGTTSDDTTNGVVARRDDSTTVQWASLLAPPRLPASTTFRLVEDAEDFRLPRLGLTVQPGLATDTSITRLVGDAFGGTAALVGAENSTIALIAEVNATLASVSDDLRSIQDTLSRNAGELGESATSAVTATRNDLAAAAASVLSNLQALDGQITSTLERTSTAATQSLKASLDDLLAYLGDPDAAAATPTPTATAVAPCQPPAAPEQAPSTLLQQIGQVSTSLGDLADASQGCVDVIRTALLALIGDPSSCVVATATASVATAPVPLVCTLAGTSQRLAALAGRIATEGARILGEFDATAVDDVTGRIRTQVEAVTALQAKARRLKPGSGEESVDGLAARLEALLADVTAARARTDRSGTATDSVAQALKDLVALAETRSAVLDGGSDSLSAQVRQLADTICAAPRTVRGAAAEAYVDQLRALVVGGGCDRPVPTVAPTLDLSPSATPDASATATPDASAIATATASATATVTPEPEPTVVPVVVATPLLGRVQAEAEQWRSVARSVDLFASRPSGAAAQLLSLDAQLVDLQGTVTDALEAVRGTGTTPAGISKKVSEVVEAAEALYDAGAAPSCDVAEVTGKPLNALQRSFGRLACNQRTVAQDLDALLRSSTPAYAAASTDVAGTAALTAALGDVADGELAELAGLLVGSLDGAAAAQAALGQTVVAEQRARLAARQAAAEAELDAAAEEALGELAAQIASSNTQQSEATEALQQQLVAVLSDLGSGRTGRGLLGLVQDSAGATGAGNDDVAGLSRAATSFRGVRLAELADAQLQTQQVQRALERAQSPLLFGGEQVPAGAASALVFSLTFRSVG